MIYFNPARAALLTAFAIFSLLSCRKNDAPGNTRKFSITFNALHALDAECWIFVSDAEGAIIKSESFRFAGQDHTVDVALPEDRSEPYFDVTLARRVAFSGPGAWRLRTWRNVAPATRLFLDDWLITDPLAAVDLSQTRTGIFTIGGAPALDSLDLPSAPLPGILLDLNVLPQINGLVETGGSGVMLRLRVAGDSTLRSLWVEAADPAPAALVDTLAFGAFRDDYPHYRWALPGPGRWDYKVIALRGPVSGQPRYAVLGQQRYKLLYDSISLDVPTELGATAIQFWGLNDNFEIDWRFAPGEPLATEPDFFVSEISATNDKDHRVLKTRCTDAAGADVLHVSFGEGAAEHFWIVTGTPAEMQRFVMPRFPGEMPFAEQAYTVPFSSTRLEQYENADYSHGILPADRSWPYWRGALRYRARIQQF